MNSREPNIIKSNSFPNLFGGDLNIVYKSLLPGTKDIVSNNFDFDDCTPIWLIYEPWRVMINYYKLTI